MTEEVVYVICVGCVTVAVAVAVHMCESVTVIVYVPAQTLLQLGEVHPVLQEKT
jgi:hypothetical protein